MMNFWVHSSFQWRALQWEQLIVRKEIRKELYTMFMKLNEWAIFIKESRDWRASKCRSVGCRLIGRHDDDDEAIDTAAVSLLRCLYDDSVRILLAFRSSARCRVRGVIDGCISSVGGIAEAIEATSLLRRNLCNVDWLYQLEMTMTIRNLIVRL